MSHQSSALVIIDVQNEFMSPNGNFPINADCRTNLVRNFKALIPRFRQAGGHIIWVKAIYANPPVEPIGMQNAIEKSNEWLVEATHVFKTDCCALGTWGAELDPELFALADQQDPIITKSGYSTFYENNMSLLTALRARGVTDVYFCGLASGTCVLATVLDAIKIPELRVHAVPDCMGWRREPTHVDAIQRMQQLPVHLVDSDQI